jgi:hypothetical protein
MDMDDDFMGEIEFNLTPEQSEIVSRAIDLASRDNDEFQFVNPLISIMQWWQSSAPKEEGHRGSPEATLVEACRSFMQAHEKSGERH